MHTHLFSIQTQTNNVCSMNIYYNLSETYVWGIIVFNSGKPDRSTYGHNSLNVFAAVSKVIFLELF